jgi:tetratricopeptide (TPR) repeat protein
MRRKSTAVVEELSQIGNICLCITSRITTIPSDCKRLDVPTLSMDAARGAFYRIYDNDQRSNIIDNLLEQLDFHPLSVTLLATVAHQNNWDTSRLAREWEQHQTSVLRTEHSNSLAATIELSLASPMFRELGPTARELLGVIAFFPQGIDEGNFDWLFPTIPDRRNIVDRFCILSLTSRSNGFITMLAPIRDHFSPRDPTTSPLLCATKDHYFARLRLLGDLEPDQPGFGESRWIISEDANVEHLLNAFTSFDADLDNIWAACADFIAHLNWHKPRSTVLRPKIEGLPDDHRSKPQCLFRLSELFYSLGNYAEVKRLLTHTLELERGQGNDDRIAHALRDLAGANQGLGLYEEGIQQSNEALAICERLGDAEGQAKCWNFLGWLLLDDNQFDAAEEATSHALKLFLDQGREYWVCDSHRLLGEIYRFKHQTGKSIHHSEAAIGIASSFDWHDQLFWIHHCLAWLFCGENEFDNSQSHIEQAKAHTGNNAYFLGRAMKLQAQVWYRRGRLEEAK